MQGWDKYAFVCMFLCMYVLLDRFFVFLNVLEMLKLSEFQFIVVFKLTVTSSLHCLLGCYPANHEPDGRYVGWCLHQIHIYSYLSLRLC